MKKRGFIVKSISKENDFDINDFDINDFDINDFDINDFDKINVLCNDYKKKRTEIIKDNRDSKKFYCTSCFEKNKYNHTVKVKKNIRLHFVAQIEVVCFIYYYL